MPKRLSSLFLLFVFIFLISGCTVARGVQGFGQGAAEGWKEDSYHLNKADAWVKKNLW